MSVIILKKGCSDIFLISPKRPLKSTSSLARSHNFCLLSQRILAQLWVQKNQEKKAVKSEANVSNISVSFKASSFHRIKKIECKIFFGHPSGVLWPEGSQVWSGLPLLLLPRYVCAHQFLGVTRKGGQGGGGGGGGASLAAGNNRPAAGAARAILCPTTTTFFFFFFSGDGGRRQIEKEEEQEEEKDSHSTTNFDSGWKGHQYSTYVLQSVGLWHQQIVLVFFSSFIPSHHVACGSQRKNSNNKNKSYGKTPIPI